MRSYLKSFLKFILVLWIISSATACQTSSKFDSFDGDKAFQHVVAQLDFGARTPGGAAHQNTIAYIAKELEDSGLDVSYQISDYRGYQVTNIIGSRKSQPSILICAHYDSRFFADMDPNPALAGLPVPGANDGASGVAILLELARVLPQKYSNVGFVFFDFEDQGNIDGMDWIIGSRSFAEHLEYRPSAVIILDMVGEKDAQFFYEFNSDVQLNQEIWETAVLLGNDPHFIREFKFSILDDHTPFVEMNIPAIDVIDFDYPYWHTAADTSDKISPKTLSIVGNTILTWLENQPGIPKDK